MKSFNDPNSNDFNERMDFLGLAIMVARYIEESDNDRFNIVQLSTIIGANSPAETQVVCAFLSDIWSDSFWMDGDWTICHESH